MNTRPRPVPTALLKPAAAFAVLALLLMAAGRWYYLAETELIRQQKHEELDAIGELKAGQIQQWRRERMNDATRMAGGPLVRKAMSEFLREPGGPLRADLLERLKIERTAGGYSDALIFAPDGKLLLSALEAPEPMAPPTRQAIAAAVASQGPVLSDFFRHADVVVHIDSAAAVRNAAGEAVAVAVLRSDATTYLYPLIQSWPTPSRSSETFIVQREGESVVWLNEARHRTNTALNFHQPLSQTNLPSVQAALGRLGVFEGVDYRGVAVLAHLEPVSGSSWFIVSKVDVDEIFAEARSQTGRVILVVGLLILLAAVVTAFTYRRQALSEIQRLNAYNRSLIEASLDPLATISPEGKVTDVNDASVQATGVPRETLIGTDFSDYFTEPEKARAGYQQVFSEGFVRDYPLAIRHTSGRVTDVLYSASVYKDEHGKVLGVFAAARDITERKRAAESLRESEQKFRSYIEHAPVGVFVSDLEGCFLDCNPATTELLGCDSATLKKLRVFDVQPEEDHPAIRRALEQLRQAGNVEGEFRLKRRDGTMLWVLLNIGLIGDNRALGYCRDITERKRAGESLRESEERFRRMAEAIEEVFWLTSAKSDQILYVSPAFEKVWGRPCAEVRANPRLWIEMIHPDDVQRVLSALGGLEKGRHFDIEYRIVRPDKAERWINDRGYPLRDDTGEIILISGVASDITGRKQAEAEREQYFKLFMASNDLMCIADPNGAFLKTNPACTRTLGYTEAELVSQPFVEFIHPEDKQPTLDEMARQQRLGYSLNFENRYRCKDGSHRWLSWRANYIPEERLTYATARDVTELKRAEQALRQAGSYNRSLIEASLDPLVTISAEGKVTDVNEASAKAVGVPRESLIGTDFSSYFTEPEKARDGYQHVFSEGFVRDYPLAIRHQDGHVTEVLYNASVYKDVQGKVLGVFAAARDVTARRQAEAAVQRSRDELNRAQAVAHIGSWRLDVRRNELTWSDEAYRIFGTPIGTPLTYETFLGQVHPEDREYVDQEWKAALAGKPYDIKHRIRVENGPVKWVRERAELEFDPAGALWGGIGTTQDVTELHRAEEAIRQLNSGLEQRVRDRTAELTAANQELESFSYAVAHDLRAPIRAMSGFSQALVEDYGRDLQGEARVFLDQIIHASRRMSELVDGLLTLSRCTRGELQRDRVDLSALCERLRAELTKAEPDRRVEWHIQPGLTAWGDARMIEVVMSNLLGNAWKYTGRQLAPVIRVYAERVNGELRFCVADNGAGFDMKHAGQLFKPFQRLHRQEEFPGIGIGLATVERILHRHGGVIRVTAAVGVGATFSFSLPESEPMRKETS